LARRWQAALRVLADPAPYARRLAQLLARRGAALENKLVRALKNAPPDQDGPCAWASLEAGMRIACAPPLSAPDTS
jgi:hypothetical protein